MYEMLSFLGIVLMVALTGIGSSIGVTICGNAAVGAMKKNPDSLGQYIGLAALPSSQGLYGFVGFFMAKSALDKLVAAGPAGTPAPVSPFAGWAILGAGIILGVVGAYSSVRQAHVCANGIQAIGNGENVFSATMVMAVFPELYSILALLVAILTVSSL